MYLYHLLDQQQLFSHLHMRKSNQEKKKSSSGVRQTPVQGELGKTSNDQQEKDTI